MRGIEGGPSSGRPFATISKADALAHAEPLHRDPPVSLARPYLRSRARLVRTRAATRDRFAASEKRRPGLGCRMRYRTEFFGPGRSGRPRRLDRRNRAEPRDARAGARAGG